MNSNEVYTLSPANDALYGMFTFSVHSSLLGKLYELDAISSLHYLPVEDAQRLRDWAEASSNPLGQRAHFARALAALIETSEGLRISTVTIPTTQLGFWELASR